MNRVVIHYCYPSSEMAVSLGKPSKGGFYVTVGCLPISQLFREVESAEGFCRNNLLSWEPHYSTSECALSFAAYIAAPN